MTLTLSEYSSSPPLWSIRLEGGKRLADQVDQLTFECCHSFRFYGSCWKRIPIRDSSMPKRILSQCGVSSDVFIGLIVWNAEVDFSCYIYFVGHIFICWCILFFWLCYIAFVVAYIYLSLSNLRFLCAVFICWCKLFFVPASFQFVYA